MPLSDLSQNNNGAASKTSSFQTTKQIINQCSSQRIKSVIEVVQQNIINATTNNNLKNLDEHEVYQKLIDQIFQHKVDSTDVLLMCGELNNIKGLNKESYLFQDEHRNNIG